MIMSKVWLPSLNLLSSITTKTRCKTALWRGQRYNPYLPDHFFRPDLGMVWHGQPALISFATIKRLSPRGPPSRLAFRIFLGKPSKAGFVFSDLASFHFSSHGKTCAEAVFAERESIDCVLSCFWAQHVTVFLGNQPEPCMFDTLRFLSW